MRSNAKYFPQEIVDTAFFYETDVNGRLSPDQIRNAALLDLARSARRIAEAVEESRDNLHSIRTYLLSLGRDGVHRVLKFWSRRAREAEQKAKARRAEVAS